MNPFDQKETLIRELGIENLSPETQLEVAGAFGNLVIKSVIAEIMLNLPESAQDTFMALIDEGKGEEAEAFAALHISDLDALIHNEAQKVLIEYKEAQ